MKRDKNDSTAASFLEGSSLLKQGRADVYRMRERTSHKRLLKAFLVVGSVDAFFVYRFIYEQFRKGYTADVFVLGLTHAQVFNMIGLPIALYLLYRLRRAGAPAPVKTLAA